MVLGGSEQSPQLDRTINTLIEKQIKIDKRVERLETLEAAKKQTGLGCITFLDSDFGAVAAARRVDVPVIADNYVSSQLTIFWKLYSNANAVAVVNLLMTIDGLGANYNYAGSYDTGGGETHFGANAQATAIVGRIPGDSAASRSAVGHVHLPFWSLSTFPTFYSDWTFFDDTEASTNQERGKAGGTHSGGDRRPFRFDFTASAGNLGGSVYLYGWCPEMTPGGAPVD